MGDGELYSVIRYIRPVYLVLAQAVEAELRRTKITIGMRGLMERLHDEGPQTVPALARSFQLERQSVQKIADQLLENGLIERIHNPAHARSLLLKLTKQGESAFTKIRTREQENLKKVGRTLSKSDIQAATRVLNHLYESFSDPKKWRSDS